MRTMRQLPIVVVLVVLVAALAWFASRSGGTDRDAPSPGQADPVAVNDLVAVNPASGSAAGGTQDTSRVRAGDVISAEDWRALVAAWLFDPARESVGRRLHDAVEQREISADACCDMILDALIEDCGAAAPRLCRDAPVSDLLHDNKKPAGDVVSKVARYKTQKAEQERHVALQNLLAGWPCYDEVSCRSTLMAAILSLSDDALWNLLRQRLLKDGPSGLAAVVAAGMEVAKGKTPRADRLALVMDAMFSFGGPHDQVMAAVHGGMAGLGEAQLATTGNSIKNEVAKFGVYGPSMAVWGAALKAFLSGGPSQPDSLGSAERRTLMLGMFDATWPGNSAEANAFHRLVIETADGSKDPRAVAYLKRVAKHSTVGGVRIGALTMLGMTQSIADIEAAYGEIVAVDASAILDSQLRIGFYAAVDNSRIMSPANRADVFRLFSECLSDQSAEAVPSQLFVLQALERNPIPELAWAVEQVMHQPGKPRVSEQASRTLQMLKARK
jgi:hypothetical protein